MGNPRYESQEIFVGKLANTAVATSTTLVEDNELVVPLREGRTYAFEAMLLTNSAAASDSKIGLAVPTGATGEWLVADSTPLALNAAHTTVGDDGTVRTRIDGTITTTDANPGNLAITFAQGTSGATASNLKAGSWIKVQLIGDPTPATFL